MSAGIAFALGVIAFVYALVGHGGASGYLALLMLLGHPPEQVRPAALLLNLCVSAIATFQFARAGHFRWGLLWPFAITSVPASYIGAGIELDAAVYTRILAICLLVAVARLLGLFGSWKHETRPLDPWIALVIGAVIGLLSGMIGIGGGILLSPVLLLMRLSDAKGSAAVSAPFILVNSAAGMLRAFGTGEWLTREMMLWTAVAVLGGVLGSAIGARRLADARVRQILGGVLLFASIKLLWT